MKTIVTAAALLSIATWPIAANAAVFDFTFSGAGTSGSLSITYQVNPNTGTLPGTSPNPVDPVGSYVITGVNGTFSNDNLNIVNAAVTGLVPVNFATPDPDNKNAPNSFSRLLIENGVQSDQPGAPPAPGLSFDNLFYPGGSPQASTDYPFSGGVFDIYGVIFTINNGYNVNLWSNGVQPGIGLNYGVAVTDRIDLLDYTSGVSIAAVPEPATWATMLFGFGMVAGVVRYRRRSTATTYA